MNWNKDEAVKAKGFALKKMESKDFVEAKKFALKAQRLCSDLDGIPQMLTVIEVHSSAAQKVFGTEMDWYGILQLGLTADDSLVKKQYRKLALLLHPDKNKMAGAEAAFKIIGDAHRVLSDRESRAKYDDRYKAFKQWQSSNLPSQTESVSLHQNQPGLTKPTFWTLCPFCSTKYQYYKDILNKHLRCQNCSKPFLAYDVNAQGLPSEANWTWQGGTQAQKASQDGRNLGPQNTGSVLFPNKGNCSHVTAGSSIKRSGTSSSYSEPKNKAGVCENVKEAAQGESQNMPKHNVGKSSRKAEVDSREKCDTESSNSVEELDTPEREKYFGTSGGNYRSSAKKRRVTYNEDKDSKNEFAEPLKDNKSSTVVEDQTNGGALKTTKPDDLAAGVVEINTSKKQKKGDPFEENLRNGYAKTDPGVKKGESAAAGEDSNEKLKSDDISESDSIEDRTLPEPVFIDVPDTEFYLFDNDKKEDCFHKDQLWAIYDYMDSMPRFYAWIKEVHSPGFKVRITWLEPNPDDQAEIDWVAEDLPVSCGKFKFQKTETTQDINMFSHVVLSAKIIQRGVFFICPAKGETWALFKKWNINWNSDPDNHRDSEFDYVEIVSDYGEESGITVAYLGKVKGFVSLFRRKKKVALYGIPANELYRFSHMVPRYRTTGKERTGVPAGCFELDPAALPTNPVDLKDI